MALELTELAAITEDYVKKGTVDIIFQDNVLLYLLMAKGKFQDNLVQPGELVDGGKKIRVFLEHAKSNGGSYGASTSIPQTKKGILNAARFGWAGYMGANAIDLDDQIQNNGDAALVDLVQAKLNSIKKTIRDYMGDAVYASAADANSLLGLGNLFSTVTATKYATIAEDDMAEWKANVITTSEAISYKVMQTIRRTAAVGQSKTDKPNLYITTDTLKDGFERTLQANVRYQDKALANIGFDNVLFGGQPVVSDDKETATYLEAINLNYLDIKTHSKYQFTTPKWEYDKEQPDTLVANSRWIGQMVTGNRKAHCRHTNLSEPS